MLYNTIYHFLESVMYLRILSVRCWNNKYSFIIKRVLLNLMCWNCGTIRTFSYFLTGQFFHGFNTGKIVNMTIILLFYCVHRLRRGSLSPGARSVSQLGMIRCQIFHVISALLISVTKISTEM